jgi:hypothetical protein
MLKDPQRNATVIDGGVAEEVAKLRAEDGKLVERPGDQTSSATASRDSAWLAPLDLGTDPLYGAGVAPANRSRSACHTTSAISAGRGAR